MSTWESTRPVRTPGMTAREEILLRVRAALDVPRHDDVTDATDVPRTYEGPDAKQETSTDPTRIRDLLVDRLEDYTAVVHRTTAAELPATIATALGDARSVVVAPGLPAEWTGSLPVTPVTDDGGLGPRDLDGIDAVLTGCHTAIALTGTIVLRGDDVSGRRVLTLIPDHHVVVVTADQVVLGVPRAIERMAADPASPWTLVSGPSATSDIELERVEGVHGPRRLDVVLVEPDPDPDPDPEPEQPVPAPAPGTRTQAESS